MASSLASLGLGSQGALSFKVIDQLRAVDDTALVTPLDTKITTTNSKKNDLSVLTTLTASLKAVTSSLTNENTYLKRTASVTGTSASVTAASGTTIQDFSVDVNNIAQSDIYQSRSFANKTSTFATANDTISLTIDGKTYDIAVDATTTLADFKDKIFDKTDGKASASILNVGGTNPYKLIIKSTSTGVNNSISMTSTGDSLLNLGLTNNKYTATTPTGAYTGAGDTLTFNVGGNPYNISVATNDTITNIQNKINTDPNLSPLMTASIINGNLTLETLDNSMTISSANGSDVIFGLNNTTMTQPNHIQSATDASFKFAGVDISRSTNNISDLIVGITLTLKETGVSNVSVTQDTTEISTNIESFVSKYNDLMSNLNTSTKYDTSTKVAGTFQGVSQVTSLKSAIDRQLLSVDNKGQNLTDYGVALNSSGILEFTKTTFDKKLVADPSALSTFFNGSSTTAPTSITGTTVSDGTVTPIDIISGDLVINDVPVTVNLSGTASANATALKNAINSANITGIEAVVNSDGTSIKLQSTSGYDIKVSGDATKLNNLGLKNVATFGKTTTVDGYFTKFNATLADYITGSSSIFNLYDTQLQTKTDSLNKEKLATVARLDTKYALMAKRFASYDNIINQLNTQFASLSQQINSAYNTKN